MRPFSQRYDAAMHTERAQFGDPYETQVRMWRVQVRRKGKDVNETFLRRKDAEEWPFEVKPRIDRRKMACAPGATVTAISSRCWAIAGIAG
jgi:hypothetical protein